MPYRVFLIPMLDEAGLAEEMNGFLRRVKVVAVEKHLVIERGGWAFCIEYLDGPAASCVTNRPTAKVDYRAVLSDDDFTCYAGLRELRKRLAEGAGVPVYAVFTNEQLAAIARLRPQTLSSLQTLEGIGEARIQAYGPAILDHLRGTGGTGQASCDAP